MEIGKLGSGSFGQVTRTKYKDKGYLAIKSLNKVKENDFLNLLSEIKIMVKLH